MRPVSAFAADRRRKDGYQCWCRDCCREYNSTRSKERGEYRKQYYAANAKRLRKRFSNSSRGNLTGGIPLRTSGSAILCLTNDEHCVTCSVINVAAGD